MFKETDLGVSAATAEQLNEVALRGGEWGHISQGSHLRGKLPTSRYGYGFKWIDTRGEGNRGVLVLTAKSELAAEYLEEGVWRELKERFPKLSDNQLKKLAHAARKTQYGREPDVQQLAVETHEVPGVWEAFDDGVGTPGNSTDAWCERWHMPRLSYWRLRAARQLVAALRE